MLHVKCLINVNHFLALEDVFSFRPKTTMWNRFDWVRLCPIWMHQIRLWYSGICLCFILEGLQGHCREQGWVNAISNTCVQLLQAPGWSAGFTCPHCEYNFWIPCVCVNVRCVELQFWIYCTIQYTVCQNLLNIIFEWERKFSSIIHWSTMYTKFLTFRPYPFCGKHERFGQWHKHGDTDSQYELWSLLMVVLFFSDCTVAES